mgnify:CR=1 FL=1
MNFPEPIEITAVRILEDNLPDDFTFEELQIMIHVLETEKGNDNV